MTTASTSDRHLPYGGLTTEEVLASRTSNGENVLTPPQRDPWWKLFLEKFEDPVIRILMIAAAVALAVGLLQGEFAEGLGIIIAILLSTTVAFFNEFKANQEFALLNHVYDQVNIKVIRNGQYVNLPRQELVVGDIIYIEQGHEVPADAEVIDSVSLYVDQAKLTGESEPSYKSHSKDRFQPDEESTYPFNRVYRSTIVTQGHGFCRVLAVGDRTEIGKLAQAVATVEDDKNTPLNRQLEELSQAIGVAGLLVAVLTFIALLIRGLVTEELLLTSRQGYMVGIILVTVMIVLIPVWLPVLDDGRQLLKKNNYLPRFLDLEPPAMAENWLLILAGGAVFFATAIKLGDFLGWVPATFGEWLPSEVGLALLNYFMVAVTIIVVAVPEGLAMSVTLSLAYSMRRMTAENNLVRRMHACETIGATTVICSDKTGTLTCNQMLVQDVVVPGLMGETTEQYDQVMDILAEAIAANSTADLEYSGDGLSEVIGNATEGALLLWLDDRKLNYLNYRYGFDLTSQGAFSAEKKYMTSLGRSPILGEEVLYLKGAPEVVLQRCDYQLTPTGIKPLTERANIIRKLQDYQQRGMRTLGFAYRPLADLRDFKITELEQHLVWLGFFAIVDPLREDVPQAIQDCMNAGIQVKIVTGDSPQTAKEIGRQIGLLTEESDPRHPQHLTGPQFAALDDKAAFEAVKSLRILSRACPLDKLRLVQLLQRTGAVVGVTGDGTNDAAALKQAEVGLAMGSGTAIAKEASDIILLNDSFSSIVNAVLWGRSLYENIQKFLLFQLTINVVALGTALLGPFIGIELPLTVTQMLWVNLIMDTFAALALATEPPNPEVLKRSPRRADAFIINSAMATQIIALGLTFLVLMILLLKYDMRDGSIDIYELSVFFAIFVFLQLWNLFNARCFGLSISAFTGLLKNPAFGAIVAIIFIGQIVMVQWGSSAFRTVPLTWQHWLWIIVGTSPVLWLGEVWRKLVPRQVKSSKS
ncbi:calcium-translocating P-type ATPase, PMCA-type [[Limnothrix rosea] IAM M-220]|uniref:calcium-translocating P-type ATPase, PMCA-type n=1 Tax=[Limnothrix rosea] IAM M-220 TaxID=454133 RepID=UPI0009613A7F|nr:calcium-translocating P-type ATPase, PMCA-type [[Limnothrix rosea] IAM M-220]OKH11419.1 calcium-translocating P-type ATPase, PMCA-type [[Limnothrix rosea] IAM M-220]